MGSISFFRACLHEGGGPQLGEVTCGGSPHLTCKHDQIKMRDYMDRGVTPPKQVTSPTWDPPCQLLLMPVLHIKIFNWLQLWLASSLRCFFFIGGFLFSSSLFLKVLTFSAYRL